MGWLGVIKESFQKRLVIGRVKAKIVLLGGGGREGVTTPAPVTNFNLTPKQFIISVVISLKIQTALKSYHKSSGVFPVKTNSSVDSVNKLVSKSTCRNSFSFSHIMLNNMSFS